MASSLRGFGLAVSTESVAFNDDGSRLGLAGRHDSSLPPLVYINNRAPTGGRWLDQLSPTPTHFAADESKVAFGGQSGIGTAAGEPGRARDIVNYVERRHGSSTSGPTRGVEVATTARGHDDSRRPAGDDHRNAEHAGQPFRRKPSTFCRQLAGRHFLTNPLSYVGPRGELPGPT